jgi:hypothetical protein
MNSAYGDESLDGTGKRVYAVSGVFGSESNWKAIARPWKKRLGGRIFHAADCESGKKDFSDLSKDERLNLYRDLVRIFTGSRLLGAAVAINIPEYRQVFPRDFEHAPYLMLFGETVRDMASLASLSIPRGRVKVTFDRNRPLEHNAGILYDFIRRSSDQETVQLLSDKVTFATRETIGVQVADLLARETMKRLDDELQRIRRIRGSFAALRDSGRFRYRFFYKRHFEASKNLIKSSPMSDRLSLRQYDEWVRNNGIQDCQSNRLRYIEINSGPIGLQPKK